MEISIVGAGIGSLTAAAALLQRGHKVRVFEQAAGFGEVGAGIQMSANAVKVLDNLGLRARVDATARGRDVQGKDPNVGDSHSVSGCRLGGQAHRSPRTDSLTRPATQAGLPMRFQERQANVGMTNGKTNLPTNPNERIWF